MRNQKNILDLGFKNGQRVNDKLEKESPGLLQYTFLCMLGIKVYLSSQYDQIHQIAV